MNGEDRDGPEVLPEAGVCKALDAQAAAEMTSTSSNSPTASSPGPPDQRERG
jgi:hypothetical protein